MAAKDLLGRIFVATRLTRRLLRGRAVVVAFHSVTQGVSRGALRCGLADFERYCAFFARHMTVVTLTDLSGSMRSGKPLAGELCVTFDDGYADNAVIAAPVLDRLGIKALFFVATEFLESSTQVAWDRQVSVRSEWMTWDQARSLVERGREIGGHTATHCQLGEIEKEQVIKEIVSCRDAITQQIGAAPRHFAVPFGRSFDTLYVVQDVSKSAGFDTVSLCRGGLVTGDSSVMQIERWPIAPEHYLSPYGWLFDVVR